MLEAIPAERGAILLCGDSLGMVQRRGRLGFALEAAKRLRVVRDIVRQEFERHEAVEVSSALSSTRAQLLDDAIVRNGLADHWSEA